MIKQKITFWRLLPNAISILGIALCFGAVLALAEGRNPYSWIAAAYICDVCDGALARALRAESSTGRRLDLITDFLLYVIVATWVLLNTSQTTVLTGFAAASYFLRGAVLLLKADAIGATKHLPTPYLSFFLIVPGMLEMKLDPFAASGLFLTVCAASFVPHDTKQDKRASTALSPEPIIALFVLLLVSAILRPVAVIFCCALVYSVWLIASKIRRSPR